MAKQLLRRQIRLVKNKTIKTSVAAVSGDHASGGGAHLTTGQVASRVGVSARTVLRWVLDGKLAAGRTAGGHWRIASADLERFVAGPPEPVPQASAGTGGAPRMVIIEDDRSHARALRRLLTTNLPGAEVIVCTDAFAAGFELGRRPPDVLFVDLEMPGFDGVDMLRRLAGVSEYAVTRVVVVSGRVTPGRDEALHRLGVDFIWHKPLRPAGIRVLLDELSRQGVGGATVSPYEQRSEGA